MLVEFGRGTGWFDNDFAGEHDCSVIDYLDYLDLTVDLADLDCAVNDTVDGCGGVDEPRPYGGTGFGWCAVG